jgi:C4-type Zn-finger protein
MQKIILLSAISLLSLGAQAADKPGMKHDMGEMKGKMQMDADKMDKHMRNKQEHHLLMHDYSNRILAEQDPAKKQKLKNEQLELMKAHHMQMMQHKMKMKQMHQNMRNKSDNPE